MKVGAAGGGGGGVSWGWQEGHIHHLARHSVACFLTRGDLWVR